MADNEVTLEINVNASDATKDIKKFGDKAKDALSDIPESADKASDSIKDIGKSSQEAGKQVSGFSSRFKDIVLGLGLVEGVKAAFSGMTNFLKGAVDEAKEGQVYFDQLTQSLIRAGTYSDANIESFSNFASELSKIAAIDDDVIVGQLALARNFAKTDEQAQKLVSAAANLAAATGVSLETAVDQLGKTLDGTAGRLNETVPALRGVSSEALKAGAAIDIVAEKFAGAASAKAQTYEGRMNALGVAFGNFQQAVGDAIINNETLNSALKDTTDVIITLTEVLQGSGKSFEEIKQFMAKIADSAKVLAAPITFLVNTFILLENGLYDAIQAFIDLGKIVWGIVESIISAVSEILKSINKITGILSVFRSETKNPYKITIDTEDTKKSLDEIANKLRTNKKLATEPTKTPTVTSGGTSKAGTTTTTSKAEEPSAKESSYLDKQFEKMESQDAKTNQDLIDTLQKGEQTTLKDFLTQEAIDKSISAVIAPAKVAVTAALSATTAVFTSTIANIGKGAEGAAPAIASTISTAVGGSIDALFGTDIFGKAIAGILDLAKDPKAIGNFVDGFIAQIPYVVNEFIKGIPLIIDGIIKALPLVFQGLIYLIPVLFKSIAEAIPELFRIIGTYLPDLIIILAESIPILIEAIADNADIIITKLVAATPRIALALAQASVNAAIAIVTKGIPNVIKGISDGIGQWFKSFDGQLNESVSQLPAKISEAFSSIGQGIEQAFKNIYLFFETAISKLFEPLQKAFESLTGGKGGPRFLTNTRKEVGSWFGLATGGVVPTGYPNDSYPASLTSGELVLPPKTADNLFAMIDNMSTGQSPNGSNNETNNLLRQLIAVIASQNTEVNVQLDRNTLAKAILTLNKDNRRLA